MLAAIYSWKILLFGNSLVRLKDGAANPACRF
jgi:hypothetical protein